MQRNYEQKMSIALEQFEKRIDWLSKGSRELFGTVIEKNICILLDTSQSMQLSLDFVKRKSINLLHVIYFSKRIKYKFFNYFILTDVNCILGTIEMQTAF